MKKIVLMMAMVMVCYSAKALTQTWTSDLTFTDVALGGEVDGTGSGWYLELFNTGTSSSVYNTTDPSVVLGWNTGLGYVMTGFQFDAPENGVIVMRLYDNTTIGSAGHMLTSASWTLPVLTTPPALGSTDSAFDFTGKTWQVIPEPATFLLFGIGGMGAWLIRRNKLQVKEEAEG